MNPEQAVAEWWLKESGHTNAGIFLNDFPIFVPASDPNCSTPSTAARFSFTEGVLGQIKYRTE